MLLDVATPTQGFASSASAVAEVASFDATVVAAINSVTPILLLPRILLLVACYAHCSFICVGDYGKNEMLPVVMQVSALPLASARLGGREGTVMW